MLTKSQEKLYHRSLKFSKTFQKIQGGNSEKPNFKVIIQATTISKSIEFDFSKIVKMHSFEKVLVAQTESDGIYVLNSI